MKGPTMSQNTSSRVPTQKTMTSTAPTRQQIASTIRKMADEVTLSAFKLELSSKSRRPKRKEDQKTKTKKAKKKAAGQPNKKPAEESAQVNVANSSDPDEARHCVINVPPPPRFSEAVIAAKACMVKGVAPSACCHPAPPQVSPAPIEFMEESYTHGVHDDTTLGQPGVLSVVGQEATWCTASTINGMNAASDQTQTDWQMQGNAS